VRILHVSDLHLGRALGDLSREAEHRAVVAEIVDAARELDVAATLLSGDAFDAYTPPAWAEDLFFELLDGLAGGGRRAVAVIAGNHDSGVRLAAADPLARRLGIVLVGDVDDVLVGHDARGDAVRVVPLAPQVARIEVPGAGAPLVLGLLPFLSEARVGRDGASGSLAAARDDGARYAERLATEAWSRAEHHVPGAVHALMMHQFLMGGLGCESERRLRIGAFADLDAAALPTGLDYIALGHLHRPQRIQGAPSPAFYAGSPIAFSFSEAGQTKRAILVDVEPGRAARFTDVPLRGGRPLEIWEVASLEEARLRASEPRSHNPIVEIRADLGRAVTPVDGDAFFTLPGVTVVSVRDRHLEAPIVRDDDQPAEVRVEQLFRDLWQRRWGADPDEETMAELGAALIELGHGEEKVAATEEEDG
jgi:DNA repair protein SbcD/Mre11